MSVDIYDRLKSLQIELPEAPEPAANYSPAVVIDNFIYISGQTPKQGSQLIHVGKLGVNVTLEDGYAAARLCGLRLLSAIDAAVGDLNKIERIIKLTVYINASDDFSAHPQVANGASDLFEQVLAERGLHARAAVGVSSLPSNAAVEVDLIAKIS